MESKKKVLFITYYWPPASGAPVNRILKFYNYLPEFGWEPVILTTESGDFPFEDANLLCDVRPDTKIFRSKGISFHKIFRFISPASKKTFISYDFTDASHRSFMDKVSRWFKYNIIPDTRLPWYFSTVKNAVKIIREEKIDLIFTSSPPQTNHLIACKAARKTGIPWVADFRDPWTDVFWLADSKMRMKFIHNMDKRIERKILSGTDAVVTVGPTLVDILQPKTPKKVFQITNGYDENYFKDSSYQPNKKFRITYAGSLSKEQDPKCFFDALEVLKQNVDFYENLEIFFIGNFPPFLHDMIDHSSYKEKIVFLPYMPYADSLKSIALSELLLMFVPKTSDNKCIITSKLFDYLGAQRPVLAFGPTDCDAAVIIKDVGAGAIYDYSDSRNAADFILKNFNVWKSEEKGVQMQPEKIEQYTRRNLTQKLSEIFDTILEGRS